MSRLHEESGSDLTSYIKRLVPHWLFAASAALRALACGLLLFSYRQIRKLRAFAHRGTLCGDSSIAEFEKMAEGTGEVAHVDRGSADESSGNLSEKRPYGPPQPWETMKSPSYFHVPPPPPPPTLSRDPSSYAVEEDGGALEVPAHRAAQPEQLRKHSYTKEFDGREMQGEILTGDGWTRHTRVYGGGVCQACLESERKASLMPEQKTLQA